MNERFVPCDGCARHVRASDPVCPFCGQPVRDDVPRPLPSVRLGRAATFAFGAAIGLATTACTASHERGNGADASTPRDAGVQMDSGSVAPAYGTPADPDGGGGTVPLYGGPPED